ncbi:MAG: hypothetical protein JW816_02320 [Candidatus Buchananbacteria bacterium]|nr:hypothetical protein [Candidatus Buchananbacteria bacterium]
MISAASFLSGIDLGSLVRPGMVLLAVLALIIIVMLVLRNYRTVPPDKVLVVYGWKKGNKAGDRGFKMITGGATIVLPLVQSFKELSLAAFQVKFSVTNVPSKEGVRVTVSSVATLKIGSSDEMLSLAARRFLHMDLNQVHTFAQEVLEGGLRGVVATLTVEGLVQNRQEFTEAVMGQVTDDLAKLGLEVDNFVIQDIDDEGGYINALGLKRTAEVKRDAKIGEAEARRDEDIKVAEAQREADEKSSAARRIGETAKAEAEQKISDAQRIRDEQIAKNQAIVEREKARVPVAAKIAAQEEQKTLGVKTVEAEQAETEARILLQEKERERKDAELRATVIVTAERTKEASVITAQGEAQAEIEKAKGERTAEVERAEGKKSAQVLKSEGEKTAAEQAAEGRKAQAVALQSEKEAEAAGQRANLLATAEGEKAKLLATAEGERAKLEAEARGVEVRGLAEALAVQKKAEAYALLDQTGKFLQILEAMPGLIEALGVAVRTAGEGTVTPMAKAIGDGLGNIKEVRIVEIGKPGSDGTKSQNPLSRIANITPDTIFALVKQFEALGFGDVLKQVATKAGIDLSSIVENGPKIEATPPEPESPPNVPTEN